MQNFFNFFLCSLVFVWVFFSLSAFLSSVVAYSAGGLFWDSFVLFISFYKAGGISGLFHGWVFLPLLILALRAVFGDSGADRFFLVPVFFFVGWRLSSS